MTTRGVLRLEVVMERVGAIEQCCQWYYQIVLSIVLSNSTIDSTVGQYHRQYHRTVLSTALSNSTIDDTIE